MCYDAYGNYWVTNYTGDTPLPGNAPQAIGGGCPAGSTTPYSVKGNNQQNGVNYDPAGNQSAYATSALLWDAENRMTAFGATTVYNYDASGQRVSKTIGGTQTNYVYDAFGRLAAEYAGTSTLALSKEYIRLHSGFISSGTDLVAIENVSGNGSPCATCFVISDDLGSVRLMATNDGTAVSRHDYLPFGEEALTDPSRPAATGFDGADGATERFTGKERDSESGLDYFGARYYGSALGRFTSPDWSEKPQAIPYADISDPQTLNLYAYVRNRPLSSADIDGHCTSDGQQKGFWWCLFHDSDQDAEDARKALAQMHGFNINGQSPADFAKNATNQQAIQGRRQADMWLTDRGLAICGEGVSCGVILPPIGAEFGAIEESEIATAERSGTALTKADAAHRSTSFVIDDLVKDGQKFWITGNDGKRRLLIQLGNQDLNGNAGRYEIIYDPETKTITHQRFVEGGTVNGQPNKP